MFPDLARNTAFPDLAGLTVLMFPDLAGLAVFSDLAGHTIFPDLAGLQYFRILRELLLWFASHKLVFCRFSY